MSHTKSEVKHYFKQGRKAVKSIAPFDCTCPFVNVVLGAAAEARAQGMPHKMIAEALTEIAAESVRLAKKVEAAEIASKEFDKAMNLETAVH